MGRPSADAYHSAATRTAGTNITTWSSDWSVMGPHEFNLTGDPLRRTSMSRKNSELIGGLRRMQRRSIVAQTNYANRPSLSARPFLQPNARACRQYPSETYERLFGNECPHCGVDKT